MRLSLDKKTSIQARSRKHPGHLAAPGRPARQEFEYIRHGTVSIIAAMDIDTGQVLTEPIERNTAATFTAFLDGLDTAIDPAKQIHLVLDNGSSHTAKHTKAWFKAHPRWHPHWTPPHASWLNMIEIWFSTLAKRVIRYGDFPVVRTLLTRSKPSRSCTTKPPSPTGGPMTALPSKRPDPQRNNAAPH